MLLICTVLSDVFSFGDRDLVSFIVHKVESFFRRLCEMLVLTVQHNSQVKPPGPRIF